MENFMAFISKYEYKSVVTKDRHTSSTKKYLELLPLPEYIKDDLNLLFIGINPGIQSSLKQHYYANPINHFWKCIYESGLVPEKVDCTKEEHLLHKYSIGMINYIERPSRSVSEISQQEFNSGRQRIERLLNRYKPKVICFNGKKPYLSFFNSQKADYGQQDKGVFDAFHKSSSEKISKK
ncbi:DNA glycosylase, G/T mismatch domain-containing protein [Rozella allomycis CSF55]|uniref:DNA glycosylase, G/T mismatch domain-containing protein n=1 Tax=Rozella allomycis (strain CSF55) TaxID=988480 RepID=A0A075AXP0_ROZAC|nr:DNA glycosylase, G/T mismatch domain-containing protein [Rozella allomycis CSF55]|eukprot:EPZ34914.1 DNA glycosylase, G/T mismatch domain-containing protein [Rozella allomycis CSF55]